MKTFIRLLGMVFTIIGIGAILNEEWLIGVSLLSNGFFLLALYTHFDNQDKIIKSLYRISDPGQFFAERYCSRIISEYTDDNPDFSDKSFTATPPKRLDDGSFISFLTTKNKKQYRSVLFYEGNPEIIHNWVVTKFVPRES